MKDCALCSGSRTRGHTRCILPARGRRARGPGAGCGAVWICYAPPLAGREPGHCRALPRLQATHWRKGADSPPFAGASRGAPIRPRYGADENQDVGILQQSGMFTNVNNSVPAREQTAGQVRRRAGSPPTSRALQQGEAQARPGAGGTFPGIRGLPLLSCRGCTQAREGSRQGKMKARALPYAEPIHTCVDCRAWQGTRAQEVEPWR